MTSSKGKKILMKEYAKNSTKILLNQLKNVSFWCSILLVAICAWGITNAGTCKKCSRPSYSSYGNIYDQCSPWIDSTEAVCINQMINDSDYSHIYKFDFTFEDPYMPLYVVAFLLSLSLLHNYFLRSKQRLEDISFIDDMEEPLRNKIRKSRLNYSVDVRKESFRKLSKVADFSMIMLILICKVIISVLLAGEQIYTAMVARVVMTAVLGMRSSLEISTFLPIIVMILLRNFRKLISFLFQSSGTVLSFQVISVGLSISLLEANRFLLMMNASDNMMLYGVNGLLNIWALISFLTCVIVFCWPTVQLPVTGDNKALAMELFKEILSEDKENMKEELNVDL